MGTTQRRPVETICKTAHLAVRKWIIHDNVEKMIYYEDASFELLGVPIAYVPFWSSRILGQANPASYAAYLSPQLGTGFGMLFWRSRRITTSPHANVFHAAGPVRNGRIPPALNNGATRSALKERMWGPSAFAPRPPARGDSGAALFSPSAALAQRRWRRLGHHGAVGLFPSDYKQYNYLLQNYFFREASSTII
jgi:LPS-assembly protein